MTRIVTYHGEPHYVVKVNRAAGWCELRPVAGGHTVQVKLKEVEG